ncbi:MAG: asparagine synthase (glutamine-hydrolyzing) [Chlamydiales bacterium]|nr:asparagine synthase (glutamine-hydrolyzing) [Chlamydiales bacterium]
MCGIYGAFYRTEVDPHLCAASLKKLAHRGPDALGHTLPTSSLFLGHARLSILDLDERANQPFVDRSGRFTIVYNGEIFNYIEIKRELEKLGHTFRTTTDTEVVLNAFIEWGEKALFRFNGMWALAIWDAHDHRLFLSRDRFGIKPLYLFRDQGGIQFASEMKAFFGVDAINERFVYNALTIWAVERQKETLLQGVERVMPGENVWITDSGIEKKRWWETAHHLPQLPDRKEEIVQHFRELLIDACRIRLRADVPFATALSGGIDSSSIASILAQVRSPGDQPFSAFIAHFPDTVQDEWEFASHLADEKEIPKVQVKISAEACIDSIDEVIRVTEEGACLSTGPYLLYKAYREHGIKISIDGHGADELLAGYIEYPKQVISKRILKQSPLRSLEMLHALHNMGMPYRTIAKQFGAKFLPREIATHRRFFTYESPLYAAPKLPQEIAKKERLDQELYRDFHYDKLPPILRRFDHCSMAHGVEVRSPFMDWRVVTFAHALSARYKLNRGYSKYILRLAMKGILPEKIRTRTQKLGFTNPIEEWMHIPCFKNYLLDYCKSQIFLENPYFNGVAIHEALQKGAPISPIWPYIQMSKLINAFSLQLVNV